MRGALRRVGHLVGDGGGPLRLWIVRRDGNDVRDDVDDGKDLDRLRLSCSLNIHVGEDSKSGLLRWGGRGSKTG